MERHFSQVNHEPLNMHWGRRDPLRHVGRILVRIAGERVRKRPRLIKRDERRDGRERRLRTREGGTSALPMFATMREMNQDVPLI